MQELLRYIEDILGIPLHPEPIPQKELGPLPLYIRETYKIYFARIFDQPLVLAVSDENSEYTISQIEKHMDLIRNNLGETTVLVSNEMTAITRRRLIEKGINFIVPGKQLFIPNKFLDLRESFGEQKRQQSDQKLLPSAQYILLYHLLPLYQKEQLTGHSFKELAGILGYTQMAVTNAVESLKLLDLCKVQGTKEKSIYFEHGNHELWDLAQPYLINPVFKKIYVDEKPGLDMLPSNLSALRVSNLSALHVYSDLNPDRQEYYAISKATYYDLKKTEALINENSSEGKYCLEVWKYSPLNLELANTKEDVVDPLSLYLSLKDTHDERIEMALNQIIEKYIW